MDTASQQSPQVHASRSERTETPPGPDTDRTGEDDTPLFSLLKPRPDDSPAIRRLRLVVVAMGAILVVLFLSVIARVYYLMSRDTPSVATQPVRAAPDSGPAFRPQNLTADVKLRLPANAQIKSHTLSGSILSLHYASPAGEGIMIIDLASGRPASHVRVSPTPD